MSEDEGGWECEVHQIMLGISRKEKRIRKQTQTIKKREGDNEGLSSRATGRASCDLKYVQGERAQKGGSEHSMTSRYECYIVTLRRQPAKS